MIERKTEAHENRTVSLEEKTSICTEAAISKKAYDLVVLDLRELSSMTDYFFICSGSSTRQVQSIADAMDEELSEKGIHPLGREGYDEARWILLDYGDLVMHIFHHETRKVYDLERLWGNAPVAYRYKGEELTE